MLDYIIRRLLLLPLTLFCIVLINFVIINLAPGEPTTQTKTSAEGEAVASEQDAATFSDDQYLQFREHYGLTLPIILNFFPWTSYEQVYKDVSILATQKNDMSAKKYNKLRIGLGDKARFIMPDLLKVMQDPKADKIIRTTAIRLMVRGGTRQAFLGYDLSNKQKLYNRKIARDNMFLQSILKSDDAATNLSSWYAENNNFYNFEPTSTQKIKTLFFETRICRYLTKVLSLDFGSLRNDKNKTVISEVTKRFKYSLTLALLPMFATFVFCQFFGFVMAVRHNRWQDISLNVLCLILYATPIFVVAPFLIEKVAMYHSFFFTDVSIPISGFSSPDIIYQAKTSWGQLWDIVTHIVLPITAIMYGGLAAQSRLSRTAILEVLRRDYVRTALAKGLSRLTIMWRYVGRNAAITIVTAIAGSLGVILGGSLIVETVFQINGFGLFFYEAIINRDYNVIMFSVIAGSCLTLLGYLVADISYTLLDPRVTLE
jgi:peptide/nickel transport system permease protein